MGFFPVGVPISLRFHPGPWSKQTVTTSVYENRRFWPRSNWVICRITIRKGNMGNIEILEKSKIARIFFRVMLYRTLQNSYSASRLGHKTGM